MNTKAQIYEELYNSGLVDAIKRKFVNKNVEISEDYYVLMADYISCLDVVKDEMKIDPSEIADRLPELVSNIQDVELPVGHGITDKDGIRMEKSLSYEQKKLYFFHELTHALQTIYENGQEQCAFFDGHTGMFFTEGATQYIAEMLYNVSKGTKMQYREQKEVVRGAKDRVPFSPLSEYQYNGGILDLLARAIDLPVPQILGLAYKNNGRQILKEKFESIDGNQGKFDEFMLNLEKVYSIDKLVMYGYGNQLQDGAININMMDKTTFKGNLAIHKELMNEAERTLLMSYINNHDEDYILQNYDDVAHYLTTSELKKDFIRVVQQLGQERTQINTNNSNIGIDEQMSSTGLREGQRYQDRYENGILVGKAPTQWMENDISSGYHIENNGEYYTNQKGEIIRPLEGDIVTMAGKYGYVNQYGEIVRPQMIKQSENTQKDESKDQERHLGQTKEYLNNGLTFSQKIALFLQKRKMLMNLPFVENYVHKQLRKLPSAQNEQVQYTTGQAHRDFLNLISRNGTLNTYKNLSKEQIKQQRAIISQIEQNLNRIDKREQQGNDGRY